MRIVDDDMNEMPAGEYGEIVVKGPNVMQGYYNNPQATAETIVDGWLRTGDMGYMDDDGYVFIVDRKKDMIIRGGENIYPREIEEVLYTHPQIAEATVIGRKDAIWGEAGRRRGRARVRRRADRRRRDCFLQRAPGRLQAALRGHLPAEPADESDRQGTEEGAEGRALRLVAKHMR